ncbi:MAG TPA: tetratricopeptide repeat protein [Oculatellaceae cyanobacterium]
MTDENWQGINLKGGNPTIKDNVINFISSERERVKSNPPQSIPYTGVANFVGRQQELETLHQALQKRDRVAISAVAGMGGIGKTELATQYAREYQNDYPGGICWLTARNANLAVEIVRFVTLKMNLKIPPELAGKPLTLQQQVDFCWDKWQPPEGLVLVVLDDVNDWRNCRDILPNVNRFRVLITTRRRNIDPNLVEEISLEVLSTDAAVELLTSLLGKKDKRVQTAPQTATDLCERLGNLPLGLHLVGQYLANDPDLSLAEMLNRLRLQDEALNPPEQQLQQSVSLAQRGVKAAFELSWQELDLNTQKVAEFLSLFAPSIIPWELVEFINESLNWEGTALNQAKKQLYKLHFIERVEAKDGYYKTHPLIREFLQEKLANSKQADELTQAFATTFVKIAQKIPDAPTLKLIASIKDVIPHLEEVANYLTNFLKDEDLISSFIGVTRYYQSQGLYDLAEPWEEKCLSAAKNRFGNDHPDVAARLNNLALLYSSQGHYSEAEPLYLQALELMQRLLGNDHPSVAASLNNLAGLYKSQGRYSEAEPLYLQALELTQRLLGNNHPDVATGLNNLALLYSSQKRYSEAEPLYLQASELWQRLLGNDHPDIATSLNNLAGLYYSQGRYAEAEPLFLQALELCERVLGVNHPNTVNIRKNLAYLQAQRSRKNSSQRSWQQKISHFISHLINKIREFLRRPRN